jgi:hypothetical protein
MLILDEQKRALHLLEFGFNGVLTYQDIKILAKYFRYIGLKPKKIKENIVDFYKKFDTTYNDVLFGDKIDTAIKKSEKEIFRIPTPVIITKKEMENIASVKNFRYEKVLFVMLVLSRYYRIIYNKSYDDYYLNENFPTILSLAKVYTGKRDKDEIRKKLQDLKMIEFVELRGKITGFTKDNFKLFYFDENSDQGVIVDNIENIVDFYPSRCRICGNFFEKKIHNQEMCNNCAHEKIKSFDRNRKSKDKS